MALVVRFIFSYSPWLCEQIYSRGVYLMIRWIFDHSVAWLPFPAVYLFFIGLIGWLIYRLVKGVRSFRMAVWKNDLLDRLYSLTAFVGAVLFFFLFLWGFNYGREPIEKQLSLNITPLNVEQIGIEAQRITAICDSLRALISSDTLALPTQFQTYDLENSMRSLVKQTLKDLGYPSGPDVRGRQVVDGVLLRSSIAGIYFPFVGEGHIDMGLHELEKPFVLAHELFHGYGITSEGSCNFLAYLACQKSSQPIIQYSGELSYWRYVLRELRRVNPDGYKTIRSTLSKGFRNDLQSIYVKLALYPDWFPGLHEQVNDVYLKAQGIKEGIKSYDRVTMLVVAYQKRR